MRPERKQRLLVAVLGPILFAACTTAIMGQDLGHVDQTSEVRPDGNVWKGVNFTVFDAPNASSTYAWSINGSHRQPAALI